MADERLSQAIQESIATAIALVNDDNSTIIANAVEIELFDAPFDDIVARCLKYRKEQKRPPGKQHIDDIFEDILENQNNKKHSLYVRIINGMLRQADGIDTNFVRSRITDFVELKQMRGGIAEAADRYQKGGVGVLDDLEAVLRKTLRIRNSGQKDYGFTLADDDALGFLDRSSSDYCKLGIPELDDHGIHPARAELLLFLAARNKGKSQFLGHCGKFGLLKGWKIAHYTLENSAEMTAQRYFQALFNGVKREGDYHYTEFYEEDGEGAVRLRQRKLKPEFIVERMEDARAYLREKKREWRWRLENLRIRRFPSGRLSFDGLEKDLDELAIVHKFVPDMILLDYPQMMKMDRRKQEYTSLVDLTVDLRGLAVERNIALVAPQQGNRSSEQTNEVRGHHGGGSIEMLAICDNAITYSQTDSEEAHGIARLYAAKVRNDTARFTVIITQHYPSGVFCMDSRYLDKSLRETVKSYVGQKAGEEDEDEEAGFEEQKRVRSKR